MNLRPIKPAVLCLLSIAILTAEAATSFAASLDTEFGDNGKVAVDLGSYGDQANAVLVQPDGKILVGGSTSNTADLDFMLFRLRADGSMDSEFNFDGTVATAIGTNDDEVFALALQKDGKILAAGYSANNGSRDFALVRYNKDGSLDRSFGLEGMVVTAVSDSDDEITGLAVQEDGKILLTGTALGDQGRVVVLARYQADGSPDFTFADEGFTLSAVGTDARAEKLMLTEEGRILVAGTYHEEKNTALMLIGYDENGDLDTSFGYEGVTVPLDGTVVSAGYGLAVRDDGSIFVAGSVGADGQRDGALFLFGPDGLPDRAFGDKGVLIIEDEADTVLYDVLVTEEMVAATGVTVAEDGMRESLLVTYSKEEGGNAAQLFQQQVAGAAAEESEDSEPIAQVVTTEMDNEEDYTFSLAAADAGSVVVAGASGAQEIASAAVRKYTIFQSSVTGTSWSTAVGNAYVLTGEAQDVTRTTTLIPGEILSGLGTVTDRGVVFGTEPLPTLEGGDSSSDDSSTDGSSTDDSTDDSSSDTSSSSSTDGTTGSSNNTTTTTDETAPTVTESTSDDFLTTESVILSVSTNEVAYCKYDTVDEDYSEMANVLSGTAGTGHSVSLGTLAEDSYTYYVRCVDIEGNESTPGTKVTFTVSEDTTPSITSAEASSDSFTTAEDVTFTVVTSEEADLCGYSDSNSNDIADYTKMDTSDDITHTANIGTIATVESYTYYVKCFFLESGTIAKDTFNFTITSSLYKNSIFYANVQESPVSPMRTGLTTALESMGNLFVSTAIAQDDTTGTTSSSTSSSTTSSSSTTDTTNSTSDTADADTEDSDFLEEGSVSEGSGTGKFTIKLEDLKPGTSFYARAYAVINGTTYYGNQIRFQTADSCFVATAAYGSLFHPAVEILRDFRDRFMLDNAVTRSLVDFYYSYSPPIADLISGNTTLRPLTRTLLMPVIGSAWLTMRFGWAWLLLPAAVMIMVSWFGMQAMQRKKQ